LSQKHLEIIQNTQNTIYLSVASVWEVLKGTIGVYFVLISINIQSLKVGCQILT